MTWFYIVLNLQSDMYLCYCKVLSNESISHCSVTDVHGIVMLKVVLHRDLNEKHISSQVSEQLVSSGK